MNNKANPQPGFNPQLLACPTPAANTQAAYDQGKEHLVAAMSRYLSASPAESRRAAVMQDLGLSEAALVALPAEQRDAAQREIDRRLNSDNTLAAESQAWTPPNRATVGHLFASLFSFGARH